MDCEKNVCMMQGCTVLMEGPRERALQSGCSSLSDAELLAILLGTGTVDKPVTVLSNEILSDCGGLEQLYRLDLATVSQRSGLGIAKALRISAAFEIGLRTVAQLRQPRVPVHSSKSLADWFISRIGILDHEEMWLIGMDGMHRIKTCRKVSHGGLHGCSMTAKDVLRVAIVGGASSFVLVHNHPSGDPRPSTEDLQLTFSVLEASLVVGTPLVDHVIVSSRHEYFSMLENGILSLS